MKRKNILIITAILIIISFITVAIMYITINDDNNVKGVSKEESGIVKKEYHSNGWKTDIVGKILYDVPVPVGFEYVEGNEKTGLIIKDSKTQEQYIWIPKTEEINSEIYEEIKEKCNLGELEEENIDSVLEYDGFYIALDGENEGNKNTIRILNEEEKNELIKANTNKTEVIETHLTTAEEMASVIAYNEKIGNRIKITNYKTLTLLGTEADIQIAENINNDVISKGWNPKLVEKIVDDVPVPKGFEYVDGTKSTGLKIKDTESLVFIWIPIENVDTVKQEFMEKAKAANVSKDIIELYESNLVDGESAEYEKLIESIKLYGGFYISQSELGYDENGNNTNTYLGMQDINNSGSLNYAKKGEYYRNVVETNYYEENTQIGKKQREFNSIGGATYENAVKVCNELYSDSKAVTSHLTYGLEYDATVLYLLKNNKNLDINSIFNDSTYIGKYMGSTNKKSLWEKEEYLNGIYGLAGNLAELTQERLEGSLVLRGGSWATSGSLEPLASKVAILEENMDKNADGKKIGSVGFRACLYINAEYDETEDIKKVANEFKENKSYITEEYLNYGYIWLEEYEVMIEDAFSLIIKAKTKEEALEIKNKQTNNIIFWLNTVIENKIQEQKRLEKHDVGGGSYDSNGFYYSTDTIESKVNGRTYKQYKQKNSSWSSEKYGDGTIGSQGCSITALAIAASGYGYKHTPAHWAGNLKWIIGETQALMKNSTLTNTMGVELVAPPSGIVQSTDLNDIIKHLKTGNPVIIHVLGEKCGYYNKFTKNQHWMTLLGITEYEPNRPRMVYVSDPNGKSVWCNIYDVLKSLCCYIKVSS